MGPDSGPRPPFPQPPPDPQVLEVQRRLAFEAMELQGRIMRENYDRFADFSNYTALLFKTTLDNAARTYRLVTWGNATMFVTGIGLFVTAAVYGILSDEAKVYSVLFGGLGVATFVAIFIARPIEQAQTALSNLVQAEMGFMDFFEQIRMWSNYPWDNVNGQVQLRPDRVSHASIELQARTESTMALLQKYLEPGKAGKSSPGSPE